MLKRLITLSLLAVSLGVFARGSRAQALNPQATGHHIFMGIVYVSTPPAWLGPDGGLIPAIVVDPQTPANVYVGTWGAGVFKSTDAGASWQQASQGLENLYINALAINPANPAILLAGTYKGKLYKSTDAGKTWFFSSEGIQEQAIVYSIVIDPHNTDTVYIATRGVSNNNNPPWSGVIYKSTDGGATWQSSISDLGGSDQQDWAYALAINPNSTNIIYAATHQHGPYRSTNSGRTWGSITNGITNFSTRGIVVDPQSGIPSTLYTGVWTKSGVFRSTDGGKSWVLKSNGITGANIYEMAIDPFQPKVLYAATYNMGVMKTSNGGNSWALSGMQDDPIGTVIVDPTDSQVVYTGTAGNGLFISTDRGGSWTHSQSGLQASSVTGLVVQPDDPATLYAGLYGGGVAKSGDAGNTWSEMNTNLADKFVHALVSDPKNHTLFALTNDSGLYYCDPTGGNCWAGSSIHLPVPARSALGTPSRRADLLNQAYELDNGDSETAANPSSAPLLTLAFAPSDPSFAYLGMQDAGLYASTDGGMNWQPAGLSPLSVWGLAIAPSDPRQLYAATSQSGAIKSSADGGGTWTDLPLPGLTAYALAFSPADGSLLAGTDGGLYRYTSPGWTPAGLDGQTVMTLAFPPGFPKVIIAGTTDGAFVSKDGGSTWLPGPAALRGMTVQSISFDPLNPSRVYFCTTTRGVLLAGVEY